MLIKTDHEIIDALEHNLHHAALSTPRRRPWIPEEREEIIRLTKKCLGIRDEWIPRIEAEIAGAIDHGEVSIQMLRATSWDGCFCAAHLYVPQVTRNESAGRLPLVLLCCGHAQGGKQAEGYRRMAWSLACQGFAVLVPDNIGQGERAAMGHRDAVAPFRCGLSVQGLIVMETMAWLQWALQNKKYDNNRIAAIGNSGGGTLTLFLGALCRDELVALSSSGYPSTFEFVAAKEKKHCHCNILPGIVGNLEMWQLYGCFAPRPLFLFQGQMDHLFPEDLFDTVCRRTDNVYRHYGAGDAIRSAVFPGGHPWDDRRRDALLEFLAVCSGLEPLRETPAGPLEAPANCYATWPKEALTADELATRITGVPGRNDDDLGRIYLPELDSRQDTRFRRTGFRQLAAQLCAFVTPEMRASNRAAWR